MGGDVSRNGKIGAGVVLFLVLAVVAVLTVGSAVGWYDEETTKTLGPLAGQKERVRTLSLPRSSPVDLARMSFLLARFFPYRGLQCLPLLPIP
ncbi:hypothetical protein E2C01_054920 [Portunus trituberculatus]|uniref:Uncharacterized protein n=1 Tax=Portunus trituberculatus TaxID=210409 RepID=A0A5B7GL30_PORTR|nr:hypothetical protein [Portunus trituberculatus]